MPMPKAAMGRGGSRFTNRGLPDQGGHGDVAENRPVILAGHLREGVR